MRTAIKEDGDVLPSTLHKSPQIFHDSVDCFEKRDRGSHVNGGRSTHGSHLPVKRPDTSTPTSPRISPMLCLPLPFSRSYVSLPTKSLWNCLGPMVKSIRRDEKRAHLMRVIRRNWKNPRPSPCGNQKPSQWRGKDIGPMDREDDRARREECIRALGGKRSGAADRNGGHGGARD